MRDIRDAVARRWPWLGWRPSRRVILVLLVIGALVLGDAGGRAWDSYRAFSSAATTLRTMRAEIGPANAAALRMSDEQLVRLREDLRQVSADLRRGHDRLGYLRWVLAATRPLPSIGETTSNLPALAALAAELTDIGGSVLGTMEPLLQPPRSDRDAGHPRAAGRRRG